MEPFRKLALFTVARDAAFVALAASMWMVGFSFDPALALGIGANVTLLFSLVLIVRALRLNEERIIKVEAWRALDPNERPEGEQGRRLACQHLEELMLRFAKTAALTAVVLSSSSLLASIGLHSSDIAVAMLPKHTIVTNAVE
jgi:hypothetical protein